MTLNNIMTRDENPHLEDHELMEQFHQIEIVDKEDLEAASQFLDQQAVISALCSEFDKFIESLHIKTDLKMTPEMHFLSRFQNQNIMLKRPEVPHNYRFAGHKLLHYSDFYFTVIRQDGTFKLVPIEYAKYVEPIPFG